MAKFTHSEFRYSNKTADSTISMVHYSVYRGLFCPYHLYFKATENQHTIIATCSHSGHCSAKVTYSILIILKQAS